MNREQLKEMGLTDEQIDKVMAAHGKVFNPTKEQLDTVTTERDSLKEQIAERDTQLDNLSKQVKDNEELTAELDRLKEENKTTAAQMQEKLDKQAFEFNLEKALSAAKVRNPKAVKALLDTEKIKLDGEKLLNLDDQLAALKESDAYLFESEEKPPAGPSFSTGSHSKGGGLTKEDFSKMGYMDRLKLKQDDPKTYDALTGK